MKRSRIPNGKMGRAYGHTQSAAARYSINPRKSGMTITPTIVAASISVLFVILELECYIFFMCNSAEKNFF
jgi:hypothetical protein